jgi:transposase
LDGLRTADGRELPLHLRQEIELECRRLWLAVEMIAEVEAEQQQAAKAAETAATERRAAAQLSRLRGVGPTTATCLLTKCSSETSRTAANSPAISASSARQRARAVVPRARRRQGRVRKTMIVAMVRKLMIALWKFLTLGVVPEGAVGKS